MADSDLVGVVTRPVTLNDCVQPEGIGSLRPVMNNQVKRERLENHLRGAAGSGTTGARVAADCDVSARTDCRVKSKLHVKQCLDERKLLLKIIKYKIHKN